MPDPKMLIEKLRNSASGLNSEDPHQYMARGVTAGDCLDAANLIEHGSTLEIGLIAMHSVSGCWLQPDSSWALECACGQWFREDTKGETRFAWAEHVRDKSRSQPVDETERLRAALEDTMSTLSAVKAEAIVDGGGTCLWIAEKLNQQMIDNRAALQHKGEVSRG